MSRDPDVPRGHPTRPGDSVRQRTGAPKPAKSAKSGLAAPRGLPAARLNEIVRRISNGHYDRADVVDQMARRIRADLDL